MKTRPILAALFVLALGAPAAAQDVVYGPDAGEYTIKIDTGAQGNMSPTHSVSVYRADTGAQLACASASNDEVVPVKVTVPTAALPLPIKGRAWSEDGCQGFSVDSTNDGLLATLAAPMLVQ